VPADDSIWLHDDEHSRRARPQAGENEPEGAVARSQPRAARGAPEVGELLAQGEVLDDQVGARTEGRAQRDE
jgi:hypothetical protein